MLIKTTIEQERMIQDWYRAHVRAHHNDGCDAPGYRLEIELGHPVFLGYEATVVCGGSRLNLGEVEVSTEELSPKSE